MKLTKRFKIILFAIVGLLLIPFVAMQFTNEVNWSPFDFLVMAILLLGVGVLCELILQRMKENKYRFLFLGVVLLLFFLVWAELAVGIFGTPFTGN